MSAVNLPFYLDARTRVDLDTRIQAHRDFYANRRAERETMPAVEPIDRRTGERRAVDEFLQYIDRRHQDRRFAK